MAPGHHRHECGAPLLHLERARAFPQRKKSHKFNLSPKTYTLVLSKHFQWHTHGSSTHSLACRVRKGPWITVLFLFLFFLCSLLSLSLLSFYLPRNRDTRYPDNNSSLSRRSRKHRPSEASRTVTFARLTCVTCFSASSDTHSTRSHSIKELTRNSHCISVSLNSANAFEFHVPVLRIHTKRHLIFVASADQGQVSTTTAQPNSSQHPSAKKSCRPCY